MCDVRIEKGDGGMSRRRRWGLCNGVGGKREPWDGAEEGNVCRDEIVGYGMREEGNNGRDRRRG